MASGSGKGALLDSRVLIILGLLATSFADGAAGATYHPGDLFPPTSRYFLLVYMVLIFAWYHVDSSRRDFRRSAVLNVLVIAVAVIGLPYYFFRSRGFRRGAVAVLGMILVLFMAGIMTGLGEWWALGRA